jgi:hypothetical protein
MTTLSLQRNLEIGKYRISIRRDQEQYGEVQLSQPMTEVTSDLSFADRRQNLGAALLEHGTFLRDCRVVALMFLLLEILLHMKNFDKTGRQLELGCLDDPGAHTITHCTRRVHDPL